jgi:hypothetical protein
MRQPLEIPVPTAEELETLDALYRTTREVRLRTPAQIVLPIGMLWRHCRREVTCCELFESMKALLAAAADFSARYNREPQRTLSIVGSKPAIVV